ncbi:carbonic anhydrase [Massilia sp. S19_KUP03_FR1]|uniref:carbonic anhydrase n=1 Tax=Massilia sp. S19_KUP03_FR1 TaxID=3025503 RepID=UPI002FCDB3A5
MKNRLHPFFALTLCLAGSVGSAATPDHHAHWAYQGKAGASHWSELDQVNVACTLSKEQSPINIDTARAHKMPLAPLAFSYRAGTAQVSNNGHTIQITPEPGNVFKAGDESAELLQFHFHTPSEEKVDGKRYALVAHFVHKNAAAELSVVAVLFRVGKANLALAPIFASLPREGTQRALASFNPADVLPADHAYFKFRGSLTTPPCTDGVRWQVLREPVEISRAQLAAFRKLYRMNARPEQPLNGRVVEVSE